MSTLTFYPRFVGKRHNTVAKNPWKTVSSRVAYENAWIRLREDQVIRPDGRPGIYGVVEIRPSVGVVAMNERDEVALVGQWRYSVNRFSWEIPRGGSHPGETDMLCVAKRELAEEAGLIAEKWEALGPVDVCRVCILRAGSRQRRRGSIQKRRL
jgi:hypothetical protein